MIPSKEYLLYTLIIKDASSGYLWLLPGTDADADTVADGVIRCFATFGVATSWLSDAGSHFKNTLIKKRQDAMKAS